jgi:four helix bundle protein
MQGYRDLQVWQKAMDLVTAIYDATTHSPKHEMFGLQQQLRRATVSVSSNLAGRHGRSSRRKLHAFVSNAGDR